VEVLIGLAVVNQLLKVSKAVPINGAGDDYEAAIVLGLVLAD
jgi:hypothetical protein